MEQTPKLVTALNAVTATTESAAIDIQNAKKVTFLFTRANHSSGSSAFSVTGTIDGTTYVALNVMISNVTNTNGQNLTRVSSVTLSDNGSSLAFLDLTSMCLKDIKITATETTDGTHTAKVLVEY